MSDTYGKSVTLTIFGESHGPAVGATVTGLAPGVPVDMEFMRGQMEKRRAKGKISTSRTEADAVRVLSGVYRGAATGTALTLVIENTNTRSGDYTKTEELLRPGHADYTAHMKYGGHQDARGGGHFSGRLTAPVVAAGSIFTKLLQTKGVAIATHLAQCAGIDDAPFSGDPARLKEQLDALNAADFAVLDPLRARALTQAIEAAAAEIPVFFASNYSLGIAVLADIACRATAMFPDADIEIVEMHHNQKLDVPSGTALTLASSIASVRPGAELVIGRHENGKREKKQIGIHSLRLGNLSGTHEILIATGSEVLTLRHEARDRTLFADGAMQAAHFLVGKPAGLYTMQDLINGEAVQ